MTKKTYDEFKSILRHFSQHSKQVHIRQRHYASARKRYPNTNKVTPTVDAGRHGPSSAGDLSREAGTFDSLRSLLDLVLVAAAMGSNHLTRPRLHMH